MNPNREKSELACETMLSRASVGGGPAADASGDDGRGRGRPQPEESASGGGGPVDGPRGYVPGNS